MSLTDRSARVVDRALARLRETYDPVPTVETEWEIDADEYDRTVERFERGSLGGAGAWVVREGGGDDGDRDGQPEALVVREEGVDGWSEPAGKHEPHESLAETAVRETKEETGVDCRITGIVRAQRAIHVCETENREPLHRLVVTFAADYAGGVAEPREGEVAEVRWVSEHPDDLRYPGVADYPIE